MTLSLFNYNVTFRRPIHFLGQRDTYYPGYTIVIEWPIEIWKKFPNTANQETQQPADYDDIPF